MSQNLSSAAVVIGALRVKQPLKFHNVCFSDKMHFYVIHGILENKKKQQLILYQTKYNMHNFA